MASSSSEDKDTNYQQFKTVSEQEKQKILLNRNSEGTQNQTKLHLKILHIFLHEKSLPDVKNISNKELPKILKDFYVSL